MKLILLSFISLFLVTSPPATAQQTGLTCDQILAGAISEIERRTIGRYYHGDGYQEHAGQKGQSSGNKKNKNNGLPPGLAKRDQLPPGLQMQLDQRGALPPGLAKRALPADLQSALPRRVGEQFLIVDDNVVLVERATGLVLDVLEGMATGRAGN